MGYRDRVRGRPANEPKVHYMAPLQAGSATDRVSNHLRRPGSIFSPGLIRPTRLLREFPTTYGAHHPHPAPVYFTRSTLEVGRNALDSHYLGGVFRFSKEQPTGSVSPCRLGSPRWGWVDVSGARSGGCQADDLTPSRSYPQASPASRQGHRPVFFSSRLKSFKAVWKSDPNPQGWLGLMQTNTYIVALRRCSMGKRQ